MKVERNVALSRFTSWKIGGLADYYSEISSERELSDLLLELREREIPWCLIGNGTNILFDDAGYRGCVIRMGRRFSRILRNDYSFVVEAGAWTPWVALAAARSGLSGIEHTVGIPATFGGLVFMNGGSQRKSIGNSLESVRVLSKEGFFRDISARDCGFSYRKSRFQESGEIVLGATLSLHDRKSYDEQRPQLLKILRERRLKFPQKAPSCGSVFKSSPELYRAYGSPGEIIEKLGFKGKRVGNIQISPVHANFMINLGSGRSEDVLNLVKEIYYSVLEKTGLLMVPEFQYCHPVYGFRKHAEWI